MHKNEKDQQRPLEQSQTHSETSDLSQKDQRDSDSANAQAHGKDEKDQVGMAVGSIPSGLFIITTGHREEAAGYLGSFIQQVSLDPLMLMIAMNPDRPVYKIARKSGELVIHVLGKEQDGQYVKEFWNGADRQQLLGYPHRLTSAGTPILLEPMCYLECEIQDEWKGKADHTVLFVQVRDGLVQRGGKPYFHRRPSGRGY